jgi:hypothetical protein
MRIPSNSESDTGIEVERDSSVGTGFTEGWERKV